LVRREKYKYSWHDFGIYLGLDFYIFLCILTLPGEKAIANFGSGASSVAQSEFQALQYYWWFMIVTAFSGQLLANMGIAAFIEGKDLPAEFRTVMRQVALTIPSTISASWLNWIIFRFTITLPLNYLLQFNTYMFSALGFRCLARVNHG